MAISVKEIFSKIHLTPSHPVNWGEPIDAKFNGVYMISLSENSESKKDNKHPFILDEKVFSVWVKEAKGLSIGDNKVGNTNQLQDYLKTHWKEKENILYIGESSSKTSSVQKRVHQFYTHKIGNHGPHSGGFWIKLLSCLNSCKVYFAECANPRDTEFKMIMHFAELYAKKSFYEMEEVALNFPFANLKVDTLKRHELKNVRKK